MIARASKPIATLSAYVPPRRKILPPGSLLGRDWVIPEDFNDPIDYLFEALSEDDLIKASPATMRDTD